MRVLVACEYSGRVRDAFAARGHDALSCDLVDTEVPGPHYRGDVRDLLDRDWDMVLAFPPCTYLTKSNAWRWDAIERERLEALDFVRMLLALPVPRIAIENPSGAIGSQIRKADQYVHPWHFGEPFTKMTGLWLHGLPTLVPEVTVKPDGCRPFVQANYGPRDPVTGKRKPAIGVTGAKRHSKGRSRTFAGIARAMAEQWG